MRPPITDRIVVIELGMECEYAEQAARAVEALQRITLGFGMEPGITVHLAVHTITECDDDDDDDEDADDDEHDADTGATP